MTSANLEPRDLTADESTRRDQLEAVVERGLSKFVEVGQALAEIRDWKLYRSTHGTFAEYVKERFGLGTSRAYQLIEASVLSTTVDIQNERQARELSGLPENVARNVFEVAKAGAKALRNAEAPTASDIREARKAVESVGPRVARDLTKEEAEQAVAAIRLAKVTETTKTETLVDTATGEIVDDLRTAERSLSAALAERLPDAAGEIAAASTRRRWSAAISAAAQIPTMSAADVAAVLTPSELAAAQIAARELTKFIAEVDRLRSRGLHVVGSTE